MKCCISRVLLSAGILSGCTKDYSLAPPADSETGTVTIKVPPELISEDFKAMYRSIICKSSTRDGSGQLIALDGYHPTAKKWVRDGETDIFRAVLPKNGGGPVGGAQAI